MGYFWWVRPPMVIGAIVIVTLVTYFRPFRRTDPEPQEYSKPYNERYRDLDEPEPPEHVETYDEDSETFESIFDLFQQQLPRIRRSDYYVNGQPSLGRLNADFERYRRQMQYMFDPAPPFISD